VASVAGVDASGRPLQATAQFDVGSITKTLVAALVLALVDEGALRLDEDGRRRLGRRQSGYVGGSLRSRPLTAPRPRTVQEYSE
jgi:hypothetical protein